ncbi:RrF2 family transcriptional regulator [Haloimpatiens sp. FM7330]|uniref:RrF2 family transcriptional regulator n=1 Tax=Haloimpatiens sp. FM7330 TaxID=3298610 RepID=UPI0036261D0E
MKISTKGRYGLKAMVDLAVHSVSESVTLKSISERQNISEGYLEQIFSSLRKSGIIKGRKGQGGGYIICDSLSDITVGDILRVLEGDLSVVDENNTTNKIEKCLKENVWDKINECINDVIDKITLQELIEKYNYDNEGYMYYI